MKKNKKITKQDKAITLIALVVTIIILLILAGVTVGLATNGTGLYDKAKLATDEYNNKVEQEEKEIAEYGNKIDEYASLTRAGGSNISYSQNEQDTGLKWIDNQPIYQKTLTYNGSVSRNAETNIFALSNISNNIDKIWVINSYGLYNNSDVFSFPVSGPVSASVYRSGDNIMFGQNGFAYTFSNITVTVQYTKTTD